VLQKDVPIYIEAVGQTRRFHRDRGGAPGVEGYLQQWTTGKVVRSAGRHDVHDRPATPRSRTGENAGLLAEARPTWHGHGRTWCVTSRSWRRTRISRQDYETAVVIQRAAEAQVAAATRFGQGI